MIEFFSFLEKIYTLVYNPSSIFTSTVFKSLSSFMFNKNRSRKVEKWTCLENFYENIEDVLKSNDTINKLKI